MKNIKPYVYIFILAIMGCKNNIEKTFYDNGNIKEIRTVKKGKLNGKFQEFYSNGTLAYECFFDNDVLDGVAVSYYQNGQIQSKALYQKGNIKSINHWDISGTHTLIDGTGYVTEYYKNGNLKATANYINNMMHGKVQTWYENGIKESECEYEMGALIKHCLYWDKEGNLVSNW